MSRTIIILLLIAITLSGRCQIPEFSDFSPDRPGMATPPFIVLSKKIQIETGYSYEKDKRENSFRETILYNTTLLRFGITKNAEVRLQTDFAQVKTSVENIEGLDPFIIGTKLVVSEGGKIMPLTSFMINLTLPGFGEKNFRPEHLAPSFYLLMQNNLTGKISLCYNFGIEYDGSSAVPTEFAALSVTYNFTDKFSGFVENYDRFTRDTHPQYCMDCGFAFLLSKNVQLDLSGNLDIQNIDKYFMFGFGISWRI